MNILAFRALKFTNIEDNKTVSSKKKQQQQQQQKF